MMSSKETGLAGGSLQARSGDQLSSSISENIPSATPTQARLISTIKARIARGDEAKARGDTNYKKADDHYKAAGIHLKQLRAERGGTWAQWEKLLKTKVGISKSRASELMAIADGTKTVEGTRSEARERMRKIRSRSPERSGETTGSQVKQAQAGDPDEEDECYFDDEGRYTPADQEASAACRIRGFLFRAQQSVFAAETDELRGLACTAEMLKAAEEAVTAWTKTRDEIRGRVADTPNASAERMKAKHAALDDGLDIPESLRRTPKAAS